MSGPSARRDLDGARRAGDADPGDVPGGDGGADGVVRGLGRGEGGNVPARRGDAAEEELGRGEEDAAQPAEARFEVGAGRLVEAGAEEALEGGALLGLVDGSGV